MASIQERKGKNGSSYRAQIRLKGHPVVRATFERKTDARVWAQLTEAAIREGRYFKTAEAKRHTLSELIDRYAADVLPEKKDGAKQKRQLEWWSARLGDYTLSDVTSARIAEARDELAKGITARAKKRAGATVNRYVAALSHVFTVAASEYGWIEDNPLRNVRKKPESRGRVRFLSDDEKDCLLGACRASTSPHLYDVVLLALATGMRKGEILGLTWATVDLARERVTLEDTKNGDRRVVPLAGQALTVLVERNRVRRLDTNLVFPGSPRRKKASAAPQPANIRTAWEAAISDSGIEDFRFHDLRHTAASYLAMDGASLLEIAQILGHKTLAMVQRYAHLTDGHQAAVVTRMNERFLS